MTEPGFVHPSRSAPGGAWVHLNATTHRGIGDEDDLPKPQPPHEEITDLIRSYLGPVRRAGRRTLPAGTPEGEDDVMVAAGFACPRRLEVGGGGVVDRTEDDVVASVYSLSWATPYLFGERRVEFEADLRALLRRYSADGHFSERAGEVGLVIWLRP